MQLVALSSSVFQIAFEFLRDLFNLLIEDGFAFVELGGQLFNLLLPPLGFEERGGEFVPIRVELLRRNWL